jgi:hypothetical protein
MFHSFLIWKINLKNFKNIFENQFTKSAFITIHQLDGKDG